MSTLVKLYKNINTTLQNTWLCFTKKHIHTSLYSPDDALVGKIYTVLPKWILEMALDGTYQIKFKKGGSSVLFVL
jgi:hypothetical protein